MLRYAITAVLLFLSAPAWGQTSLARLTGRVIDPTGAMVPGATVVATNQSTGAQNHATTNETGVYVLPFLPPGKYTVTGTAGGFKKYERKDVVLETAEVAQLDMPLEVGAVTDVVEVTATSPLLESASSAIGQFIEGKTVEEMPLAQRRALELVRLSGNVIFVDYANFSKPRFSVAGGRSYQAGYLLDGGNIQNLRIASAQVDIDPPVEVIQEFKVMQNSYSAEYGGSASGLLVSTTKSGTNNFHGSGFEYFRNEKLDAATFFAPTDGTNKLKAPLRYNLFGGTVGGPIRKNRTHFFAGYEGTRRSDGSTDVFTMPTLQQRLGDFSQTFDQRGRQIPIYDPTTKQPFAGNIIPAARLDPVAKALLPYYAMPNRAAVNLAGAQNFSGNKAQVFRRHNVTSRADHIFSDANRFYFRFIYNSDPYYWTSALPNKIADPTNPFGPITRWQTSYLAADTHTFTPTLVMDTRYSFSNRKFIANSAGFGSNVIQEIGLKGVPGGAFPALVIAGISNIGSSAARTQAPIRQHQIIDNWTWVHGNHFVKFGAEVRKSINLDVNRPIISGQYNFSTNSTGLAGNSATGVAMASFLLGYVNTFSLRETDPLDRYSYYLAGFVQDDWKLTRDLTLNVGMRWETDTPIMDKNDRMNSFDPYRTNPISKTPGVVTFVGANGVPRSPYDTDLNNFGPRFGFAWRPGGQEKWVVRGGFGVFFGGPDISVNGQTLGFDRSASLSSPDSGVTPSFILKDGLTGVTLGGGTRDDTFGAVPVGGRVTTNVDYFDRKRPTVYSMQSNIGIQRQVGRDMVIEISYLGNLSRKIPNGSLNINQVPSNQLDAGNAQVKRPYPQFGNVTQASAPIGMANYHSGMIRAERRFSHGLSFLASYTFSRNIGNATDAGGDVYGDNQVYMDLYNRKLDKGPDALDIIQRFVWSSVWELPVKPKNPAVAAILGGWNLGSVMSTQSGAPFTVTTQTNNTNSFSAANRANLLRDGNLPNDQRTVDRWFDTSAFVDPPAYRFGNAGRGILRGDGRINFDFSIAKNFRFGERKKLQFRAELMNAFNHPDFAPPAHALGAAAFGTVSDSTLPRQIQLGARINF